MQRPQTTCGTGLKIDRLRLEDQQRQRVSEVNAGGDFKKRSAVCVNQFHAVETCLHAGARQITLRLDGLDPCQQRAANFLQV